MILETNNLTKQFNGKGGCSQISLSIAEGEIFCFLGKNGAGKSTFVRTILGILHPTSGNATLLSRPIGDVNARKQVGYLPELFQFYSWLTGHELLKHYGKLYGIPSEKLDASIAYAIETVGLIGHEHKHIKDYSKGMKQRLGIATAIVHHPAIVFLDEPTSALDPVGRKHVRDIVLQLKKQGTTVFLNTHLLSEVELVADRVGIMDQSKLIREGSLSDLVKSPLQINLGNMTDEIMLTLSRFDQNFMHVLDSNQSMHHIELFLSKEHTIPELTKALVDVHGEIYRINQKENILEEVFLKMVGEEDSR